MPFSISIRNAPEVPMWTFEKTKAAKELQKLFDADDRKGYEAKLFELSKTGQFTLTDLEIYELKDRKEKTTVPIKFQVKGSVITWSFITPKDKTRQDFRDKLYNTAAIAHTSVENSCETYYRGTNHYHLKKMHTHSGESGFNHNHYRTANDGPITPKEVYEHLHAFYAQEKGKEFIPDQAEIDDIILKYAAYWAEFDNDINYIIPYLFVTGSDYGATSTLESIAIHGGLQPEEVKGKLESFFKTTHGQQMLTLMEKYGYKRDFISADIATITEKYGEIHKRVAPKVSTDILEDVELETPKKNTSSSRSPSPREQYTGESSQIFDEIDKREYAAFAQQLTRTCRSVDNPQLGELTPDQFRKGMILYNALRCVQGVYGVKPPKDARFHADLLESQQILKMCEALPSLMIGSSEDDIGSPLIVKLIEWVKTASPELETWVKWVAENGSRGLGSELAHYREESGKINPVVVTMSDRKHDTKIAQVGKDVDLESIFNPIKGQHTEEKMKLTQALNMLISSTASNAKALDPEVVRARIIVAKAAINVLDGNLDMKTLGQIIDENQKYNTRTFIGSKSKIEELVEQVDQWVSKDLDSGFEYGQKQ
jgi:hypothetical protein